MSARRSVLIVTSSYAPAMIADMHRARLLAWDLPALGWAVEILSPGVEFQHPSCIDDDGQAYFAPAIPVHSARPWAAALFRLLTARSIGWRALVPMAVQGLRLLRDRRFDLVYITTTQFSLFLLGVFWRRVTGTPYVLDLHDPVYTGRVARYRTTRHRFKRAVSRAVTRFVESRAMRSASGLVSVSPHYLAELRQRYAHTRPVCLADIRNVVIPFGARPEDLARVARSPIRDEQTSCPVVRIVYVGVGGQIMARSLRAICRALRLLQERGHRPAARLRIELHGTTYGWREGGDKPLRQLARECGMAELIEEFPARVSYRRSLELLHEADGVLVLGVDHGGYMPSKLFGYALSGKPLLAALHADSPARAYFQRTRRFGHLLWFDDGNGMPEEEAVRTMEAFLAEAAAGERFDRLGLLQPVLSCAMAAQHAKLFERCLDAH